MKNGLQILPVILGHVSKILLNRTLNNLIFKESHWLIFFKPLPENCDLNFLRFSIKNCRTLTVTITVSDHGAQELTLNVRFGEEFNRFFGNPAVTGSSLCFSKKLALFHVTYKEKEVQKYCMISQFFTF